MSVSKRGGKTDIERIEGDPGVGGLLADPTAKGPKSPPLPRNPDDKRTPSQDPEPPRHHRDWSPNKKPAEPGR